MAVQDGRWRKGSAPGRAPNDEVAGLAPRLERNVAGRRGPNRENRLNAGVAAHHEDETQADDGTRRHDARRRGQRPELAACDRIVPPRALSAVGDYNGAARVFIHHRTAERGDGVLVTWRAPPFRSSRQIERRDEAGRSSAGGLSLEVRVALNDHLVAINRRRAAEPIARVADQAEVFLPDQVPVEIVAEEAFRAERDDHARAVGRGRRRGEGALEMPADAWNAFVNQPLPENLPRRLVETE